MTETTDSGRAPASAARQRQFRIVAGVVVVGALALILWLVLRDNGSSSPAGASTARGVTVSQIHRLAAAVAHPIFWLGPKPGSTYELTRESNGSVIIRYLPKGVGVGSSKPYLSVATYPFPGAYSALESVAKQSGSSTARIARAGIAVLSARYPNSVHVAYPGVDYQVEVYDPTPGLALGLVAGGKLAAVGSLRRGATTGGAGNAATATSIAGLTALARTLGHPIYWIGPKKGFTYELQKGSNGSVSVRYLPPGASLGTSHPYLAVGTYPFRNAFATIKTLAAQPGAKSIRLPRGGLAVVGSQDPNSIHLAFPGSNVQVEVFDPAAFLARHIVASGQVSAVG
jgi:hypothetical protein